MRQYAQNYELSTHFQIALHYQHECCIINAEQVETHFRSKGLLLTQAHILRRHQSFYPSFEQVEPVSQMQIVLQQFWKSKTFIYVVEQLIFVIGHICGKIICELGNLVEKRTKSCLYS
ncbi:Hypothetical_protein [Hexamita inflata]|uniref:Hypothetical_protein n=1 Tax=Hexamita inflata TaxID=28002 RepID=A0ABP1HUQ7_9EUKA